MKFIAPVCKEANTTDKNEPENTLSEMVTTQPAITYVENDRTSDVEKRSSTPVSARVYPAFRKNSEVEDK